MEKKFLFGNYLILWVILLFGQLNGCNSCIEKEKKALLELKTYMVSMGVEEETFNSVLHSWSNETKRDCCQWEGVECSRTSGRVTEIAITEKLSFLKENSLLNLSLLHPFEELRSLNLSGEEYRGRFSGFFDDSEGYKSLRKLKNLEILDLSDNSFSSSIFPFINDATSLKSLSLQNNLMEGSIPAKALKNLINLELLDLSFNRLNGSMPDFTHLTKLKSLDLSGNAFSSSFELQGIKSLRRLKKLEILDLSWNNFNSSIFLFIEGTTSLKSLSLMGNIIEGTIPLGVLRDLTNLEVLKLGVNRLNGSMSVFCEMKNLRELNLNQNKYRNTWLYVWDGFVKQRIEWYYPNGAWKSLEATSHESISQFLDEFHTIQLL